MTNQKAIRKARNKAKKLDMLLWYDRSCFTWYLFDNQNANSANCSSSFDDLEYEFEELLKLREE